ncbi:hypothetical protein V500_01164 [Pseudogymnoascus sp. VKM F-4518 (FW-2643)]|nr:hypothetical protein V500_01164 [Pseudogymnoascus sp. VKM F-4518 (FW-2643)]
MYQATNVYLICGFAAIVSQNHEQKHLSVMEPLLIYGWNVGGGLFGFDISSMSGVLATQAYKRYYGNPVSSLQGAITAAMPLGSLVGALISSFIADKLSRRTTIQISCIIWVIGSMRAVSSPHPLFSPNMSAESNAPLMASLC